MALANPTKEKEKKNRIKCHKIQLKIVYQSFFLLKVSGGAFFGREEGGRNNKVFRTQGSVVLWKSVVKKLDLCLKEYDLGREALHVFFSLYLF